MDNNQGATAASAIETVHRDCGERPRSIVGAPDRQPPQTRCAAICGPTRNTTFTIVPVLGPPAAGKSTVISGLLESHGGTVFRLREFARRRAALDPDLAAAIEATTDPLGWFSDAVATTLLDVAVMESKRTDTDRLLYLENYPGNARQASHVADIATRRGQAVAVEAIELVVPDTDVHRRSRMRLVCATCEPDPHRPAPVRAESPGRCARCGSMLEMRAADSSAVFSARLARYRDRIDGIRGAFAAGRICVHRIPAACDRDVCIDAAWQVIRGLLARSSV